MAKKITQAVIFAGGMGMRLRPLTLTMPKPMVPVNGRPFLEYVVEHLRENGITDIVILLGYLPEKIAEHFGDGKKFGVNIRYSITPPEWENGARLRTVGEMLDDDILLLYSDNYLPIDLDAMTELYRSRGSTGMLTVYNNRDAAGEYGSKNNVKVQNDGLATYYGPALDAPDANAIDVGFFIMPKSVLEFIVGENPKFQDTVLPGLIARKQLSAYRTDHPYYPITSAGHIPVVEKFFEPKKVVFLDRDGVINKKAPEHDYIKRWKEFEFLPGSLEALKLLADAGYQTYIISNQRGIARGVMTEGHLAEINTRMIEEIERGGGRVDDVYYCPHGDDDKCFCRKPSPGLFYKAARDHHVDLTKAVMIGDSKTDVEAAGAAGVRGILIKQGGLLEAVKELLKRS